MIYLIHADGRFPNLALMRLSAYFKQRGLHCELKYGPKQLWDESGVCYGSSIFRFSEAHRQKLEQSWGEIQWGGTGVRVDSNLRDIDSAIDWESVPPDYSIYPAFEPSIGFTQRGCRLSCKFCVVPQKEGKPQSVHAIYQIWRGNHHPKKILLLDNDFFGQPRQQWMERIQEIVAGDFRVSFCQGINIRQVDDDSGYHLSLVQYRDNEFRNRILYTAWDNLGDEQVFKRGVKILREAGIPPKHLRVYMLIGYTKGETWEQILHRFNELVALGCEPYPMVYNNERPDLKAFQRWAVTGLYRAVRWHQYKDPRLGYVMAHTPYEESGKEHQ
jgi:hypothetical protein